MPEYIQRRTEAGRVTERATAARRIAAERMELDHMIPWPYHEDGLSWWWKRPAPQESTDERIARLVTERLHNDPWTCLRQVRVEVQNRVVILEGCLESARARWAAVDHAWQTPGVFDVCDVLTDPGQDGHEWLD